MSFYRKNRKIFPFLSNRFLIKQVRKVASKKVSPGKNFSHIFSDYKKIFFAILQMEGKGSLTVEASIVVPFFLFVACNLMYITNFFYKDATRMARMTENARNGAIYSYAVQKAVGEETLQSLGFGSDPECTYKDDNVDLFEVSYESPIFVPFGFLDYATVNRATCHMWTGYKVIKGAGEENHTQYVYVTPTGDAYHTYRDCSYITVAENVSAIPTSEITDNSSYRECKLCKNQVTESCYYVAQTGDVYHKSISCSALKRTVWVVTIEEAQEDGKHPCSRCQGR